VCQYCGCRDVPLLRDFIAEHESARALADETLETMERGDLPAAGRLLDQLAADLRAHWRGEERGLFAVMSESADFADYIGDLEREHRELDVLLTRLDLGDAADREALREAVAALLPHITKEEDGLFPASLVELSGEDWNRSIAAWQDAHAGERLRTRGI
jgi:iron-sulfur cluster repair protein YtfE (RIC family)